MRIDFECSGGFANLHLSYHIDTDALPDDQAEEILKHVENSNLFELQQRNLVPQEDYGPPDVFSYRLSLSEEGRHIKLTFNDATAPKSIEPLLSMLRKLAFENKLKGS